MGKVFSASMISYSITKHMVSFFGDALSLELKTKADLLVFEPLGITSQIFKYNAYPISIPASYAARTSLSALDYESTTTGHISHWIQEW